MFDRHKRRTYALGDCGGLETAESLKLKFDALEELKGAVPANPFVFMWLTTLAPRLRVRLIDDGLLSSAFAPRDHWLFEARTFSVEERERLESLFPNVTSYQWKVMNRRKFVTYFAQRVSGGPIKIGRAFEPAKRLRDLQNGAGERLLLLAVSDIPEADLHLRFERHRLPGLGTKNVKSEWFQPADEIIEFIKCLTTG